jgi:hypothetical protein
LRARGLSPVADNQGKDFQSFHVKDPDGFDLQISNGNRRNRRQGAANGKTPSPAPFEATSWKTVWLDHISFEVSNYKETAAFYNLAACRLPGARRWVTSRSALPGSNLMPSRPNSPGAG